MPRLGAREATMFHPGYGLIPCPEKAPWTRIGGDSERFLKVFFVLRTIREQSPQPLIFSSENLSKI